MAAITSTTSGNWSAGATWTGGVVPGAGDTVRIQNTHAVTIDQDVSVGADTATPAIDVLSGGSLLLTNPAASYTLTLKGDFYCRSGGTINWDMSSQPNYTFLVKANFSASLVQGKYNFICENGAITTITGASKTRYVDAISTQAASGQNTIVTTSDNSSNWKANDTVIILSSLAATNRASQMESRTISSFSTNTITLNSNLTYTHAANVYVENLTRNIVITSYNVGAPPYVKFMTLDNSKNTQSNVEYRGTFLFLWSYGGTYTDCVINGSDNGGYYPFYTPDATVASPTGHIFTRCIFHSGNTSTLLLRRGATFIDCFTSNKDAAGIYAINDCVDLTFNGCYFQSLGQGTLGNIKFGSEGVAPRNITITDSIFDGNTISGVGSGSGIITINSSGNIYRYCAYGIRSEGVVGLTSRNDAFTNNTQDLYVTGFNQIKTINSSLGSSTKVSTSALVPGGYIAVHGIAGAGSNQHYYHQAEGIISSVGDGLTDTTVHTSGTDKFAVRFAPSSSITNLPWTFDVPTGNIQDKVMTVAVWVKINNAAFYAGTHQKPRLTINFDNGTTSYAEASASTEWQLLAVNFTPTTSYGQITVTISGRTDATSTNAYFYVDDFAVLYPAGYKLDLGGLDLWANALPITPPIATVLSAKDVWTALTTENYGTNTIGSLISTNLDAKVSEAGGGLTTEEHDKLIAIPGKIKVIDGGELPIY